MAALLNTLTAISQSKADLLQREADLWKQFSAALIAFEFQQKRHEQAQSPVVDKKVASETRDPLPRKHLLTVKEAAERLSLSTHALDRWRRVGKGPKYVKIGYAVRYPVESIESYIESRAYSEMKIPFVVVHPSRINGDSV